MSLLKDIINEMVSAGSVGAGSIAGVRGSLFGSGVVDVKHEKKKGKKKNEKLYMIRRPLPTINNGYEFKALRSMINLFEQEPGSDINYNAAPQLELKKAGNEHRKFDPQDVLSKMISAEKKSKANDDTVAFGLEDEEGQIVKVYVRRDQAEEFETALAQTLAGANEDDDDVEDNNSAIEIAEVLFKLRDRFDIVDVEWPHIEGDVEEEQEATEELPPEGEGDEVAGEGDLDAAEGELGDEEGAGPGDDLGELDDEMIAGPEEPGEGGGEEVASALTQVIDMMKADAEAKKAEAEARTAEAKAKESEYVAKAAEAKVGQEEQLLDIEAHEEKQKKSSDEAKRLAKLAKYRHEVKSAEVRPDFEEEEETDKISVKDFADFLRLHLQGDGK